MNCQHEGCRGQADAGQEFCSDHCRQHAGEAHAEHACECGHPACTV
ncbi:MAG: hypothetical protein ACREJR_00905 [Candidatus Rokuibacteriota bacterium]